MSLTVRRAFGHDYLDLATRLLQQARLGHPTAGLWEAADIQWWWRKERPSDAAGHDFWLDGDEPVGAVMFTDWGRSWACDLLVLPDRADPLVPELWRAAVDRVSELGLSDLAVGIRDDDHVLRQLAADSGFSPTGDRGGSTWMRAADRPPVSEPAAGYQLTDRSAADDRPHHMIPRSDGEIARRLAETSLYRPDLDLFVLAPNGDVAAYGIFWHDPVTGVGFVEPMRTERDHQGRGLAKHVLTSGLDRLAALGADRLRVNYEVGNTAAERLYFGAGFELESTNAVYVRTFGPPGERVPLPAS